jgi:ribosomal protein S12 methylthiotransferase accessory factor
MLHTVLVERLGEEWDVLEATDAAELPGSFDLLVTACDGWEAHGRDATRGACRAQVAPWLPVWTELGRAALGPAQRPGRAGCRACAEFRRERGRLAAAGYCAMRGLHEEALAERPAPWLTHLGAEIVAAVVSDETRALVTGDAGRAQTDGALLFVSLDTLEVTRSPLLPYPVCPRCGALPDDTPASAMFAPSSAAKPTRDTYRLRLAAPDPDDLVSIYASGETALVGEVKRVRDTGFVTATAHAGVRHALYVAGHGHGGDAASSTATAILEALERYAGFSPLGKRTIVRAPYSHIAADALDPRALGPHSEEQYGLTDFPFQPFGEDVTCNWVWGYSFQRERPVLVPETVGYYGLMNEDRPFFFNCSSGCAIGSGTEEAILHAILEVIERDAFLLTWHAALPAPRIELGTVPDQTVKLRVAALEAATGYGIDLYDITLEHGIPSVWLLATAGHDGPQLICGAGAHLDPVQAVIGALDELALIIAYLTERYAKSAWKIPLMLDRPSHVKKPLDHALLCSMPAGISRLAFLTGGGERRAFDDSFAAVTHSRIRHPSLRDDLSELVGRFLDTGMDVVVVDQTTPEHAAADLHCVKAIIPGMLPMTFGHDFRRLTGLPRLTEVPRMLGYRNAPSAPGLVNVHPHPFF